jgi:two-component system, OmpR family, response regulator RegX3
MKHRIVLVDDDPVAVKVMRFVLDDAGYETVALSRASQALDEIAESDPDLVILDANLPDMDGFALCRELRARRYAGPLIFLTARKSIDAKLEGFRIGADDYLTKPYEPLELVARVHGVIRRFNHADKQSLGTLLRVDDAELSISELTYHSSVVPPTLLTPTEMRFLECLMRNRGIVISRDTLIERVWGSDFIGDTNRVDVYIRRVRRKIEQNPAAPGYLHTVRGIGYVFRVQQSEPMAPAELIVQPTYDESLVAAG